MQIDVCRQFHQPLKTILYAESPKPFKTSIQIPDTNCCELKPGQPFRTQLTLSVLPPHKSLGVILQKENFCHATG